MVRFHDGTDGEEIMDASKMKVAYAITERNDKTFWNRIGVAFVNRDGSINVKLDAFPTSGTLQIRDYEPRDEHDAGSGPRVRGPFGARTGADAPSAQSIVDVPAL
jgi:hypothetical protein